MPETDIVRLAPQMSRLDAAAAPDFKRQASEALESRPARVLIDLGAVEFVDSTGLGVMVGLLKQMAPGGRIAVAGANASVRRLFQITRLDSVFALAETRDDAEARLGG